MDDRRGLRGDTRRCSRRDPVSAISTDHCGDRYAGRQLLKDTPDASKPVTGLGKPAPVAAIKHWVSYRLWRQANRSKVPGSAFLGSALVDTRALLPAAV